MMIRKVLFIALAFVVFGSFLPISTLSAPKWKVCVVDGSNHTAVNVLVRESYKNYSAEFQGHEQDLYTGADGCVQFESKLSKRTVIQRAGAILSSAIAGVHASFGPYSSVTAFQGSRYADDVRSGYVYSWRGSPSQERSLLKLP